MCKAEDKATKAALAKPSSSIERTKDSSESAVLPTRAAKIAKLNERVRTITAKKVASAGKDGELEPEFIAAQRPATLLRAGAPVYQQRSATLVALYTIIGVGLVIFGASQLHPLVALASIATVYIGYDLYSGFVHVVLDHPDNIRLPLLGQPCLEFQWHRAIPDDLVRKDFCDVCGDLNVVIGLLMLLNVALLDLHSPIALTMGGTKILMAYVGQFSHMSAHTIGHGSGSFTRQLARVLQDTGLMISTKAHWEHHQAPYDKDFCLIGLCNPIIDALRRITVNNTAWIVGFVLFSLFDLVFYSTTLQYVVKEYWGLDG